MGFCHECASFAHCVCEDARTGHRSETGLHGDNVANASISNGTLDLPHDREMFSCFGRRQEELEREQLQEESSALGPFKCSKFSVQVSENLEGGNRERRLVLQKKN